METNSEEEAALLKGVGLEGETTGGEILRTGRGGFLEGAAIALLVRAARSFLFEGTDIALLVRARSVFLELLPIQPLSPPDLSGNVDIRDGSGGKAGGSGAECASDVDDVCNREFVSELLGLVAGCV
mmetsp:Transcript_19074/g.26305  ORF Transcript_19074/g.26305 Transcript_19074/m.26305 type:complete len:127 (+) Transcript_19074:526-906(+)